MTARLRTRGRLDEHLLNLFDLICCLLASYMVTYQLCHILTRWYTFFSSSLTGLYCTVVTPLFLVVDASD